MRAPVNQGVIHSCFTTTAPTIDGDILPAEWIDGKSYGFPLYSEADQTDIMAVNMTSVYDANNLYLALVIPDATLSGMDMLMIVFRTNTSAPIVDPLVGTPVNYSIALGNDAKVVWVHNNHSVDAYITGPHSYEDDVSAGGVEDSLGKCKVLTGMITFELTFPLNTGDTIGCDPALSVGDNITIFTYYEEGNSGKVFSQYRENDDDFDFNILHIGCPPSPPTTTPPTTTTPQPTTTTTPTTNTTTPTFSFGNPLVATGIVLGSSGVISSIAIIVYRRRKQNK